MSKQEDFDIKSNHKKYPVGDERRITDIAEALTEIGEREMKKGTALGVALKCQDETAMKGQKLVKNFAKKHTNQTLQELKAKVEKLQEYYYHNTDEETADITHKTLEDVLQLINEAIND